MKTKAVHMSGIPFGQFRALGKKIQTRDGLVPNLCPIPSEEEEESHDLQGRPERDPEFLLKIITGDETSVYRYNLETKQQMSHWKSPSSPPLPPKKARQICSNV
jgi:hypothetical protein